MFLSKINENKKDIVLSVELQNNTKVLQQIVFNKSKLYVNCAEFQDKIIFDEQYIKHLNCNECFLIENEKKEFVSLSNLKYYEKKGKELAIDFDASIHCDNDFSLTLVPNGYARLENIILNKDFIKINSTDRKIRLWHIYKKKSNIQKIVSNWISL